MIYSINNISRITPHHMAGLLFLASLHFLSVVSLLYVWHFLFSLQNCDLEVLWLPCKPVLKNGFIVSQEK